MQSTPKLLYVKIIFPPVLSASLREIYMGCYCLIYQLSVVSYLLNLNFQTIFSVSVAMEPVIFD